MNIHKTIKYLILGLFLAASAGLYSQKVIKGVITDKADNTPLPGANIIVKNENNRMLSGTITDLDGQYTVKIPKEGTILQVTYIGYKSLFMDWDNFVSSAKYPMDGLVKEKIIADDNPNVVIEFLPKQIKCKRKDQRVVVIIEDV